MAMRCSSLKECLRTRSGFSSYSMETLTENQEQQSTSARPLYFQSGWTSPDLMDTVNCHSLIEGTQFRGVPGVPPLL